MGAPRESIGQGQPGLADFIRGHLDEVMARWTERVRSMAPARAQPNLVIMNELPRVLERMADAIGAVSPVRAALGSAPKDHAMDRLALGYDLEQVVDEYSVLRTCIFDVWHDHTGATVGLDALKAVDQAIDQAIADSAACFARARERVLVSLDRISDAALGTQDSDASLRRLLQATLASTEAVDAAVVFLREGDTLRPRVAVGLAEVEDSLVALRIGEHFVGRIAATGETAALRDASNDPAVGQAAFRGQRTRALYGVPMVHDGEVLGVVCTGSRTTFEFSSEDKVLLRAMVARATAIVVQAHLLRSMARRELEFRTLADNITQLAWMADETGWIFWYNRRWFEFTGTSLEEMKGWGWKTVHHPDHLDRVIAKWTHSIERGVPWEDTFPLRGAGGQYRWFLSRASPIRDQGGEIIRWFGTNTDITEQREIEESQRFLSEVTALLASSLDYTQSLENITRLAVPRLGDVCVVDLLESDGRTRRVAASHADPAKAPLARELLRFPLDPSLTAGIPEAIRRGARIVTADVTDEYVSQATRDPEHRRILRLLGVRSNMVVPMIARERLLGTLAFASSAPDRYGHRDLELATHLARRAALAIDNARLFEEAQRAVQLREDVLSIVSHDLRNPLSSLDMALTLLLKAGAAEPGAQRPLQAIRRASARMSRLISDLLDMTAIREGRLSIELRDEVVGALVDEAVQSHSLQAQELKITLTAETGDARETRVRADRERLLQVFGNLIANALKFSDEGGRITVRAERRAREIEFSVRDTGRGIPASELPRIFERYWSSNGHHRGTAGLGLYISKGIIEAHGGRIWAESKLGSGSTFVFTLPQ